MIISLCRAAIHAAFFGGLILGLVNYIKSEEPKNNKRKQVNCRLHCGLKKTGSLVYLSPQLRGDISTSPGPYGLRSSDALSKPDILKVTYLQIYGHFLPKKTVEPFSKARDLRQISISDVIRVRSAQCARFAVNASSSQGGRAGSW